MTRRAPQRILPAASRVILDRESTSFNFDVFEEVAFLDKKIRNLRFLNGCWEINLQNFSQNEYKTKASVYSTCALMLSLQSYIVAHHFQTTKNQNLKTLFSASIFTLGPGTLDLLVEGPSIICIRITLQAERNSCSTSYLVL